MGEPRAANPLVEQFRRGGVPKELRLMAAQGLLPLNPVDFTDLLHQLLTVLASPYEARADLAKYQEPPADDGTYRTFCGT